MVMPCDLLMLTLWILYWFFNITSPLGPRWFSRTNCTSWMSAEEQMWNQRNQVRAAKMWWLQRSLALGRKEYKRLWNLVKIPLITSSLMSHLGITVCMCVCWGTCGHVYEPTLLSLTLCITFRVPVSFPYLPFLLLTNPFQTPSLSKPVFPGCWKMESWQDDSSSPGPGMVPSLWKPQWWQ